MGEEVHEKVEERPVYTFEDNCTTKLYTMKLIVSGCLREDLDKFGSVCFLDLPAYEHFNVALEELYW